MSSLPIPTKLSTSSESGESRESPKSPEKAYKPIEHFEDCIKNRQLMSNIFSYGWEEPSTIQKEGIPAILTGKDCLVQAQSGTGKTGTFTIALLATIDLSVAGIQAVIVSPSRELATQTYNVLKFLANKLPINIVKTIGQEKVDITLEYPDGPTILVGTCGKTTNVLNNNYLKQPIVVKQFIIDECDDMLKSGNNDNLKNIQDVYKACVSENTQVVLVSATINDDVLKVTKQMFRPDAIVIKKQASELTLEGIHQFYIQCASNQNKFPTIMDLYSSIIIQQCVIFVNSKKTCDYLQQMLIDNGYETKSIHGGMPQEVRTKIMKGFRDSEFRVLLSTDLTSRGIDIQQVSIVINYDLPRDKANYLHRIGRCGRYGRKGVAISLLGGDRDMQLLNEIMEYYNTSIPALPSNFQSILNT